MAEGVGRMAVVLFLGLGACAEDNVPVQEQRSDATGASTVRGTITRSAELADDGDGLGTVHVGLTDVCARADGTAPRLIASLEVPDADLSEQGATVPFELEVSHGGTLHAAAWFDDVVNAEQDEALPGKGDLAMFAGAAPICVPVELELGSTVSGVELDLNYLMPFDLTGSQDDGRGGVNAPAGEAEPLPVIDTSDPNTYAVIVTLTRSVDPAPEGDGVGTAAFALSDICVEATGDEPEVVYSIEVPDVDLSEEGASATVRFEGIPNGVYQLSGFLDDVDLQTPERPLPSTGDLVSFGGFGAVCEQVIVNGADAEAEYDLNFLMTWDLNE